MRCTPALAFALVIAGWPAGASLAQVVLRGGGEVVDAPIVRVSRQGVEVGGDEPRVIGWDAVREVRGEHAEAASAFMGTAERAWRARLRLARGDVALAAPMFDLLFREFRDEAGPTALLVAEGALRCRLEAGDEAGAIEAWLAALRNRRAGWKLAGDPPLRPMLDEATGLAPALVPRAISDAARPATAIDAGAHESRDAAIGTLAGLYRTAPGDAAPPPAPGEDSGVLFVRRIVEARAADGAARAAARAKLIEETRAAEGTWREAWARAAVGLSLLDEPEREQHELGVIELLHVPARFSASLPRLAATCLRASAAELDKSGDAAAAAKLREEASALDGTPAPGAERDGHARAP